MKLDFIKPPKIGRLFYKDLIFKIPEKENRVYLTFDDGPNPETTPFILETLKQHNAKATFFCLGKNVEAYPALFQQIINEGHGIGNHGYNHLNGWQTETKAYIEDLKKASEVINSNLFRPPYGKIKVSQIKELKERFKIIIWDVSAQDYRMDISAESVKKNILENTTTGSIIVMHDSLKAKANIKAILSHTLKKLGENFVMDSPIKL